MFNVYTFGYHANFTRLFLLRYVPLLGSITGTSRGDIRHISGRDLGPSTFDLSPLTFLRCKVSKKKDTLQIIRQKTHFFTKDFPLLSL